MSKTRPIPMRISHPNNYLLSSLRIVGIVIGFLSGSSWAASIDQVSIPVNSMDGQSHPVTDNVWLVAAPPFPFNVNVGIGFLINPTISGRGPSDFSLHDHGYLSANVPDPTRAVVTYHFQAPTVVDQLALVEHANGITQIEGYVGDSLGSLASIGTRFGTFGDVVGPDALVEQSVNTFDFNNLVAGTYFRFVVTKTNLSSGWAAYRAFPSDSNGVAFSAALAPIPEPETYAMMMVGLGLLGFVGRRKRQKSA